MSGRDPNRTSVVLESYGKNLEMLMQLSTPESVAEKAVIFRALSKNEPSLEEEVMTSTESPVTPGPKHKKLGESLADFVVAASGNQSKIQLLKDISEAVNDGLSLEDLMNKIFENFRPLIPYNRIGFALMDKFFVKAVWARSDSSEIHITPGFTLPMRDTSLGMLARKKETRIINDLETYLKDRPQSVATKRVVAEGGRSSLTCPLVDQGKCFGFLFFTSFYKNTYKQAHIEVFQHLASSVVLTYQRAEMIRQLREEKARVEKILSAVLPEHVIERFKLNLPVNTRENDAVILFADMVGFTQWSSGVDPEVLVTFLNNVYWIFDELCGQHGVSKVKTIGDCYMAMASTAHYSTTHSPTSKPFGADSGTGSGVQQDAKISGYDPGKAMADFAFDMLNAIKEIKLPPRLLQSGTDRAVPPDKPADAPSWPHDAMALRIGMARGPCVTGVTGKMSTHWDIWGDTVNTASRMESTGERGRIQVTEEFAQRLKETRGHDYVLEPRGTVTVKGKGELKTFWLSRNEALSSDKALQTDMAAPQVGDE